MGECRNGLLRASHEGYWSAEGNAGRDMNLGVSKLGRDGEIVISRLSPGVAEAREVHQLLR